MCRGRISIGMSTDTRNTNGCIMQEAVGKSCMPCQGNALEDQGVGVWPCVRAKRLSTSPKDSEVLAPPTKKVKEECDEVLKGRGERLHQNAHPFWGRASASEDATAKWEQ